MICLVATQALDAAPTLVDIQLAQEDAITSTGQQTTNVWNLHHVVLSSSLFFSSPTLSFASTEFGPASRRRAHLSGRTAGGRGFVIG
jgi:hypothetical protein